MALFDLEPRPLLIASCAAAALVLGVATVVSRELRGRYPQLLAGWAT